MEISLQENINESQNSIESIEDIANDVICQYSLNKKQEVAFKMAIKNVVTRHKQEETGQIIGYIGGPGGTGKSQVIKAVVEFHQRMKMKNTLKLTANTGTDAR